LTWTKDIIEALVKNLTDRIALAIFLASAILSSLILISSKAGLALEKYQFVIFGCLLVSACYLPTGFILHKIAESSSDRKRQQRLFRLTKREKEILAPYVHNNWRIRRIYYDDPVARVLADDGVLYAPDVPPDSNKHLAYGIQDWALSFLMKHSELVGPPNGGPQSGYER
jgi:Super-infection exclusion protein B